MSAAIIPLSSAAERVRAALACGNQGCPCHKAGSVSHCPNPDHPDRHPSLSVSEGDDKLLVRCHAGCAQAAVIVALRERGVWEGPSSNGAAPRERLVAVYVYTHIPTGATYEKGCFERSDGSKRFAWRPTGSDDWKGGLNGARVSDMALLGADTLTAVPVDDLVVLTEGEKARQACLDHGLPAVCGAWGASQTTFGAAFEALRGRPVIVWADHDDVGLTLARRSASALTGIARTTVVVQPPGEAGDDAVEYFARGGSAAHLLDYEVTRSIDDHPSPIDAHPQNVSAYGENERLWTGLVRLADVEAERVTWLWPSRIPSGKLTLLDGDPGLGKSTLTLDLAARISTGTAMPDGARGLEGPAGVVLLSAEDGLGDTIRPRLEAAGADLTRVIAFRTEGLADTLPTLADLQRIEAAIRTVDAKLLIIDPLMAFIGAETNSYRDQDIRRLLAPLAGLAERLRVAIVLVRHLNKASGGNALYRGGGSIGIIGAARSGLLVAADPDDEQGTRRVLASTKNNLAPAAPALVFRVEGNERGAARVVWSGTTTHTAVSLLAVVSPDGESRSVLDEAIAFLREALADGARPSDDVMREARSVGLSEATLRRARAALRITPTRQGFGRGGRWVWALPVGPATAIDAQDAHRCSPLDDEHQCTPDDHLWDGGSSATTPSHDPDGIHGSEPPLPCTRCEAPALRDGLCTSHLADALALAGRTR